ncbi:hypothetical protein ACPW96_01535 [Micromonospora sp. DT81.3]|uniref:hypothetical protein n=1 Tax=Micromonospora sp. DT81.3 TaxID=3416523 RepID=UPI003CEBB5B9
MTTTQIDPRSYLKAGQTWTTVACVRPAMQAAIDEAHKRALSDPNAVVEIVIPPGVGRLTTRSPRAPINQSSAAVPKSSYDNRIGFGLRANLAGRIIFRGSGGQSRASVIRLSDNARNLFWIDSDTGIAWIDTAARESSGAVVKRPAKPLMLRNVLFQGFAVDNNFSTGNGHIVCGTVPSYGTSQRYVSVMNVHAADIDVWGVTRPATPTDQNATSKAPFVYVARHFSDYEGNGGPANGTLVGHAWKGWDLETVAGRSAAHTTGWTWMRSLSFSQVRATNTTRGIIVIAENHAAYSHWVDDIAMDSCEHRQDAPYTSAGFPQTSFFIGGSCQGGSASVTSCTSVNVGDDGLELGGMQSVVVRGFTSVNACLSGIYLRFAQPPLDWTTTKVVIEDSTFSITGETLLPTLGGVFRSVPIDTKFTGDAAPYALGELQVTRCATVIDGTYTTEGIARKGVIDRFLRRNRYGWFLIGPVVKASYANCTATLSNVLLNSSVSTDTHQIVMWHSQQKIPPELGVSPSITVTDCRATVADVATNGARGELVGVATHTMGSSTTTRFRLEMTGCDGVFTRADIARLGWLLPSLTPNSCVRHVVLGVAGIMTSSTADTCAGVAVFDEQPVASSRVLGITTASWGSAPKVDTSAGPMNSQNMSRV